MTLVTKKKSSTLIQWIRLVAAGLIFFYAQLTLVDFPFPISMLTKLKAIEDGGPFILFAFVLVVFPKYHLNKVLLLSRLLALIALILLLNPAWQASSLMKSLSNENEHVSYSWTKYFLPSSFKCNTENFIVKTENEKSLESLLCIPNELKAKQPCILILHGGGFTTGAAIHGLELAKAIASFGYVSLSLDYRLAPKTQFPGQLRDIDVVWARLKESPFASKFDTSAFFLIGESAGASIALNYAQFVENKQLKGVVNLYGITDFALKTTISAENERDLKAMVDAYRGNNAASDISPLNPMLPINIPVLSIHGEMDAAVTFKQALEFHQSREKQNQASEIFILPWAIHLFNHPAKGPSGQVTTALVNRFIEKNS